MVTGTQFLAGQNSINGSCNACTHPAQSRTPTVTVVNGLCTISPNSNDGTGYTYRYRKSNLGMLTWGSFQSTGTFSNLTNGTTYTFKVRRKRTQAPAAAARPAPAQHPTAAAGRVWSVLKILTALPDRPAAAIPAPAALLPHLPVPVLQQL